MPWQRYAYDLRGHGATALGSADGTLAQLTADLCAFLDQVSGPAACVGFSLGGTVVLSAAAGRPDLVTRAIVLGTSTVVGRGAVAFYEDRIGRALSADGSLAVAMREDTVTALHRTDHDVDSITAARLDAVGDGRGYANAARAMAAVNAAPLTPRLREIACPVTVIGAEHDAFCPRKAADIILDALPSADYRQVPGAGHLMNLDNPAAVSEGVFAALDERP
jgi:pimeloyl-ACP methyl ester carboxylesterase